VADYRPLDISITSDNVSFRGVGGGGYNSPPAFTDATFERLDELYDAGDPAGYGLALFEATFTGNLREGYHSVRQEVEQDRARWRVRLDIDPTDSRLNALWWECLRDDRPLPQPLATSTGTLLSRFTSVGNVGPPRKAEKIKILVVVANPTDLGKGEWKNVRRMAKGAKEKEFESLKQSLKGVEDRVELVPLTESATVNNIRDELRKGVHVLHVVANGAFRNETGVLLLEADNGRVDPVFDERLALLVNGCPDLQLAVLAACQSGTRSKLDPFKGLAAKMLQSQIPAVVAMQDFVTVDVARTFARYFYRSLFVAVEAGGMVDAAMNIARDQVSLCQDVIWDWAVPVLFMRGEGRLFEPASRPVEPSAAGGDPRSSGTSVTAISSRQDVSEPLDVRSLFTPVNNLNQGQLNSLGWVVKVEVKGETHEERVMSLLQQCEEEDKIGALVEQLASIRKSALKRDEEAKKRDEEREDALLEAFRTGLAASSS
jgi:CHAT domain